MTSFGKIKRIENEKQQVVTTTIKWDEQSQKMNRSDYRQRDEMKNGTNTLAW